MNKHFFFTALMFAFSALQAQDYRIIFSGTGASTTVITVEVKNLTKNISISISGSDTLLLGSMTAMDELKSGNGICLKTAPNPMYDNCTFSFETYRQSHTAISLSDISGKTILDIKDQLPAGQHSYKLVGINKGIYLLKVTSDKQSFTSKIISLNNSKRSGEIKHISSTAFTKAETQRQKSAVATNATFEMPYDEGDIVRFTGISGDYKTIVIFEPSVSPLFTIGFLFEGCFDSDNNHYPVVVIGTQKWMAENLRTTQYKDYTKIPVSMSNAEWKTGSSDKYCWYKDDSSYKPPHGALYNGYAVNTEKLCPVGWHIPTNAEWNTLINYLDYSYAGKKMKADTVWRDDSSIGRNASGFSAIPGSYRDGTTGLSGSDIYQSAYYWTSTPNSSGGKLRKQISSYYNHVQDGGSDLKAGLSVRCIKD